MSYDARGFLALIDGLGEADLDRLFRAMGLDERWGADADWRSWAHHGQIVAPDDPGAHSWQTWVLMAGRGFGKTLAGAQWIRAALLERGGLGDDGAPLEIALIGATIDEARRVMIDGRSGLLSVAADAVEGWHPSRRLLRFRGGARATLFSGASPEALRGPEHHLAWCDELAKWERAQETWDMMQLGLRLGERPRALVTTTPRGGGVLARIIAEPGCVVTGGATDANPHLPAAFKTRVHALYAGTRMGEQELQGRLLADVPGALWTVEGLEVCRLFSSHRWEASGEGVSAVSDAASTGPPPTPPPSGRGDLARGGGAFTRICIGVDPPSGGGTCGIIVCARDEEGIGHVLADHSVTGASPESWARAVADAARIHGGGGPDRAEAERMRAAARGTARDTGAWRAAERAYADACADPSIAVTIVAEVNQGGRMVEAVLRGADPTLHIKAVTATRGKAHRAEPVARLFEAGKVMLHGRFPELEAEMLRFVAGGDYEGGSPDRADAMVWALGELMLREREVRVRGL